MWSLSVLALILLLTCGLAAAQCDGFSGPSGNTECVKFSRYDRHQWATCITDAYMRQKSHHKHLCRDQTRTYCWYQCMLETHSKSSGHVSMDCYCDPLAPTAISPTLSPGCYSPSGDDCDWFRNCLERKYPCDYSSTAYALKFAKMFCAMYKEHASKYSHQAQNWMDSARKCLLVSLVPLLRPWVKPTCQAMRQKALNSHTSCFLEPDEGATSICDLDCSEYFKIFWTIRESFFGGMDTAWDSLRAMWNIGQDCDADSISKCFGQAIQGYMRISKVVISKVKENSAAFPDGDARKRLANKLGWNIIYKLNFSTKFLGWLAYPGGGAGLDSQSLDVILVLVDKQTLGIAHAVLGRTNFDYIFNKFVSNIKKGTLPLTIDGISYWVRSLALCSDKACLKTQPLAFGSRPNHDDKSLATLASQSAWIYGVTVLIMLNHFMPFAADSYVI